jgi:hypothetical protein
MEVKLLSPLGVQSLGYRLPSGAHKKRNMCAIGMLINTPQF